MKKPFDMKDDKRIVLMDASVLNEGAERPHFLWSSESIGQDCIFMTLSQCVHPPISHCLDLIQSSFGNPPQIVDSTFYSVGLSIFEESVMPHIHRGPCFAIVQVFSTHNSDVDVVCSSIVISKIFVMRVILSNIEDDVSII